MAAHVLIVVNPFAPLKDAKHYEVVPGQTIYGFLRHTFPGWVNFDKPTICLYNGKPIKRWLWKKIKPKGDDLVTFIEMPGSPVTLLYFLIASIIVTAVVVSIMPKLAAPSLRDDATQGDPVYSLRGQRNQVRLGGPIEVPYGAPRMWPSYASQPYNQYRDNDQWLYQIFCLGQGLFDISEMRFEDTNVTDFTDVEIEVVPPGGTVSLFPTNVVTSSEVASIELYGPNEPAGSGVYVEDSAGDPDADPPIPATGHYGWSLAGPYVANPTLTEAHTIECDVSFPRGLYLQNNDGALTNLTVTVVFEYRPIDAAGAPTGDGSWSTLETLTKTMATATPQRFTVVRVVAFGRYQVRAYRSTNKDTSTRAANTVIWDSMRAFLVSEQTWGDTTIIAVKARASNNLNDNSAQRFNVLATRKLPIWDVDTQTWSAPTATRSAVWAFCDVFRSQYGARIADMHLALDELAVLDADNTDDGYFFDYVFDQSTTVWEAARTIGAACRSIPMMNGSLITLIKDVEKTVPVAVFNQDNIVKGSFRWEIKLWGQNPHDGLKASYIDPVSFKEETVLCCLPGEAGDYPEEVTLLGVKSRQQAYELGMYRRAMERYTRENMVFATGMEGNIPQYGDLIAIGYDIPLWGQNGTILAQSGSLFIGAPSVLTLTLSEPVEFGVGVHKMLVRRNDGSAMGPFIVEPGADEFHVLLYLAGAEYWDSLVYDGSVLRPLFLFGPSAEVGMKCRVQSLTPGADRTVQIVAINQDSRVYSLAGSAPVPETPPQVPFTPALPFVRGLVVNRAPGSFNEIIATWFPARGAQYYVIQISYDSVTWETINDNFTAQNIRFSVRPETVYVRVCAVNKGQGPWAYWVGPAPVDGTNVVVGTGTTPNPVTGVTITPGFGVLWLKWTNPTNAKIKNIHIYSSATTTQPPAPLFSPGPTQTWLAYDGLANNTTRYLWFVVESVDGLFSTTAGPYTGTTTNGITLDDLIPGGLVPVEIATVLPSSGNFQGRQVYLTVNDNVGGTFPRDKVYKWTNPSVSTGKAYWEYLVPAVDISGQLTDAQIADIAAAKLTGQITTTQITDDAISTPKIAAGAITTNKIAANAVTANEIAANTITAAKIAAGTITANEIAANAITASKLDADAVTAGKIQAGAITATAIGANQIITYAANIADAVITSAKINDLTASKLTAGTITAAVSIGTGGTLSAGSGFSGFSVNTSQLTYGTITMQQWPALNGTILSAQSGTHSAGLGSYNSGSDIAIISAGNSTSGGGVSMNSNGDITGNGTLTWTGPISFTGSYGTLAIGNVTAFSNTVDFNAQTTMNAKLRVLSSHKLEFTNAGADTAYFQESYGINAFGTAIHPFSVRNASLCFGACSFAGTNYGTNRIYFTDSIYLYESGGNLYLNDGNGNRALT